MEKDESEVIKRPTSSLLHFREFRSIARVASLSPEPNSHFHT